MCVDSRDCWVSTFGPAIVATRDGGSHWAVDHVAPGRRAVSVWCISTSECWGTVNSNRFGRALHYPLIHSTDGGHSWHGIALHPGVTELDSISCGSPTFCVAMGGKNFSPRIPLESNLAVVTTDGGQSWHVVQHLDYHRGNAYSNTHIYDVWCATSRECFAAGLHGVCNGHTCSGNVGAVMATFDSGSHWRFQAVPPGSNLFWSVTCADAQHCWAVGRTGEGPSDHGVIIATTDGGTHWPSEAPPPGTLTMNGISCSDDRHCTSVGFRHDLSSVIVTTSDAGRHWQPQGPPAGATLTGLLWCWSPGGCLAPAKRGYPNGPGTLAAS